MRATGLFFLRTNAFVRYDRITREPVGIALPIVERERNGNGIWVTLNTLLAKWKGPQALEYFERNRHELRAGRPLLLDLDRLHGSDGEWQAYVTRLELAPLAPSWRKDDDDAQAMPPQPAAA
jgi:hypothetical protein